MSHKPRPIKVVETALSIAMKADEIEKETAKTGKVIAVVAVMSIFKKKSANCRALFSERRGLLAKERKEPIFHRKFPADRETFLKKQEKVGYQRN